MTDKPSYEELERRVRELERAESERKQMAESRRSINEHLSFYRNAVGSMEDYKISVLAPDYRYRIVSPQYLKIFNLTGAEIVGRTVAEIMGDDVYEHAIKPNLDWAMKGRTVHYSDWFKLSDKGKRCLEISYYPVVDEDQEVVSVIAMSHDITEKRIVGDALRDSEERYRRITAGLTDYIYTVKVEDGKAVETTHSPACEAVTGYTAEEFAADPYLWIRMLAEEDRDRVIDHVRGVYEGKEARGVEHRIVRKNGRTIWVSYSTFAKFDAQGRLVSYDGVIKDITELKAAEEALLNSEQNYRNLVENANEAIFVAQEQKLVFVNPITSLMTGYSAEELQSRPFIEFIHQDDREMVLDRHARRLKGEEHAPLYSFRVLHKDGSIM